MEYEHQPVLLKEVIEYLNCRPGGVYLDGTLGRGGHTEAILKEIGDQGRVIGIDRDPAAVKIVRERLAGYRSLQVVHGNYVQIPEILKELGLKRVDGMLFDLGVSSPQFDEPERGFSYQYDAPLDMRMNLEQDLTAADMVNSYSREELTRIIREYGEEKWASRIGEFIVRFREREPVQTTYQLVEVIKAAIPASARRSGGHPARRTFQALRIAVNDELNQLEELLERVIPCLDEGARLCIISFHSLEDRIVKHTFRELAKDCVCPPDFPVCVCDKKAQLRVITRKPVRPVEEEIERNPRARSARLRVAERVLK